MVLVISCVLIQDHSWSPHAEKIAKQRKTVANTFIYLAETGTASFTVTVYLPFFFPDALAAASLASLAFFSSSVSSPKRSTSSSSSSSSACNEERQQNALKSLNHGTHETAGFKSKERLVHRQDPEIQFRACKVNVAQRCGYQMQVPLQI
jgi:hypothetical protein